MGRPCGKRPLQRPRALRRHHLAQQRAAACHRQIPETGRPAVLTRAYRANSPPPRRHRRQTGGTVCRPPAPRRSRREPCPDDQQRAHRPLSRRTLVGRRAHHQRLPFRDFGGVPHQLLANRQRRLPEIRNQPENQIQRHPLPAQAAPAV